MGKVSLFLIYDYAGTWEEEWRAVQHHSIGGLLTRVSHDTVEHAILGFSRPLVKALGLFPKGMLHKLPTTCESAQTCPIFIAKNCLSTAKGMPWCFEPAGLDLSVRQLGAELIRLWREEVYVVVVEEEPVHAGH
jgi:hypothetical protein